MLLRKSRKSGSGKCDIVHRVCENEEENVWKTKTEFSNCSISCVTSDENVLSSDKRISSRKKTHETSGCEYAIKEWKLTVFQAPFTLMSDFNQLMETHNFRLVRSFVSSSQFQTWRWELFVKKSAREVFFKKKSHAHCTLTTTRVIKNIKKCWRGKIWARLRFRVVLSTQFFIELSETVHE